MKAKNKGKRGSKNLHKIFIVKSDWLEFSCLKAKKLRELDYEWNRPEKKESQKAVQEKRLAKGKQLEEDGFVNTGKTHLLLHTCVLHHKSPTFEKEPYHSPTLQSSTATGGYRTQPCLHRQHQLQV